MCTPSYTAGVAGSYSPGASVEAIGPRRRRLPRRWLLAVPVVLIGALLLVWARTAGPPDEDRVTSDMVMGGDLLAYEVRGGVPHVVFRTADGLAVRRDQLRRGWISIEWPLAMAWQLSGNWFTIVSSDNPASVGLIPGSAEIFGEINSPLIRTMEVEFGGSWHPYAVASPGYAVPLEALDGAPTGYRWLDANGNVVPTLDRAQEPR